VSKQNLSVEQFLAQKRNELVLFQQKASEVSTRTFDDLGAHIIQLTQMMQTKDTEITRLQQLCEKNKIEHKPKIPNPPNRAERRATERKIEKSN